MRWTADQKWQSHSWDLTATQAQHPSAPILEGANTQRVRRFSYQKVFRSQQLRAFWILEPSNYTNCIPYVYLVCLSASDLYTSLAPCLDGETRRHAAANFCETAVLGRSGCPLTEPRPLKVLGLVLFGLAAAVVVTTCRINVIGVADTAMT